MSNLFASIALPWGTTIPSVIEPKTDEEVIRSSVIWIVMSGLQERVMRPTFGSMLPQIFANPMDAQTLSSLKQSVQSAITQWENRVAFVDFTAVAANNTLNCRVLYRITVDKASSQQVQIAEFSIPAGG